MEPPERQSAAGMSAMRPPPGRLKERAVTSFGPHFLIFVAAAVCIVAVAVATDWRWLYWVPLGWGLVLAVHYLIYKGSMIDDRSVDERTEELRPKSDDRDRIRRSRSKQGRDEPPPSRDPPA